jgi:hypothetical protein
MRLSPAVGRRLFSSEDRLILDQITAALVATSLLAAPSGSAAGWDDERWARAFPRSCAPELQRCLEKLETRLQFHGRVHDWLGIEQALRELHETDPECALLLRGAGLYGL